MKELVSYPCSPGHFYIERPALCPHKSALPSWQPSPMPAPKERGRFAHPLIQSTEASITSSFVALFRASGDPLCLQFLGDKPHGKHRSL